MRRNKNAKLARQIKAGDRLRLTVDGKYGLVVGVGRMSCSLTVAGITQALDRLVIWYQCPDSGTVREYTANPDDLVELVALVGRLPNSQPAAEGGGT